MSDGASDSAPSDDNLDDEEIIKLIPKKYGKRKYVRGVEEVKKKKVVIEKVEKPKIEKKPKAVLMPCMIPKKDKAQP